MSENLKQKLYDLVNEQNALKTELRDYAKEKRAEIKALQQRIEDVLEEINEEEK